MRVNNMRVQILTKIKPYTDLIRLKTSSLSGIGFILGMWIISQSQRIPINGKFYFQAFLGFTGGITLTGALNTFNDIKDFNIDQNLKSERSLPQGVISIQRAKIFTIILLGISIIASFILHPPILIVIVIFIVLGLLYSVMLQNVPLIKNLLVAFLMSSPLLIGAWVASQKLPFLDEKVIFLFGLSFIGIILFEWQKDIGDVEIDKLYNKITLPAIIGTKNSAIIVYLGLCSVVIIFWLYLANFKLTSVITILVIIQLVLILSASELIWNQQPEIINQTRKRIYSAFAITLGLVFFIS